MKTVIIFIHPYGAMGNGKQTDKEIAQCLLAQYRHPALGWHEAKSYTEHLYIFSKEETK